MTARRIGTATAALALLAFAGFGCGPSWTVVKQASPNPLAGVKDFALENVSFPETGMRVGDKMEDQWLAEKNDEEKSEISKDKQDTVDAYASTLNKNKEGYTFTPVPAGQPSTEKYTVRTIWTFLERGAFTAVFNFPTEMHFTVQVLDQSGAVVDEVAFKAQQASDVFHPVPGQRQRDAAEMLGEQVVSYLKSRTAGAK